MIYCPDAHEYEILMRMKFSKRIVIGLVVIVVEAAALGGVYFVGRRTIMSPTNNSQADNYPLLARRIFARQPNDTLINFIDLRTDTQKYFTDNGLTGSLYFEYLPTGSNVRVRGDDKQFAASLLKLPLAMEFYKEVEQGLIDANKTVILQPEWLDSGYGELYKKGVGYQITLSELTKIMLIGSDNTALKALAASVENIMPADNEVFKFLDVDVVQNTDKSVSIGARGYSSILKCLYFSCYINNDHSQLLLSYLTQTPFNDRLVAGIEDKSVKIAHKIGVFQETTQSDCGIVYLLSRPYILCIMLDGKDDSATDAHIAALSRLVYTYVKDQ